MKTYLLRILPPSVTSILLELREWVVLGNRRLYYSQFGEDIMLQRITRSQPPGFYVDVGACHPKRYSNTNLLYKKGWRGMNIDANPFAIDLFRLFRPRDINLFSGIGLVKETHTFYMFTDPRFNTFSKDQVDLYLRDKKAAVIGTKEIAIKPLREVLADHNITKVDFLNVDAEFMDMEVLQSIDWNIVRPRIIAVESHKFDFDHPHENEFYEFLTTKGYTLHSYTGYSLIFVRAPSEQEAAA